MLTKIRRSGEELFISLPNQVMSDVGWEVGQEIDVSVSEGAVRLMAVTPDLERLAVLVHKEALDLFEGDEIAKDRWMANPVRGLGNRTPNKMLCSAADIETVRLLIGRLERGSLA